MFYLFLLGVAALGGVIYLLLVMGLVPGLKEARFGVLEPLPPGLGEWQKDAETDQASAGAVRREKREVRYLFEEGGLIGSGKLLRQVRFRDALTDQIVRVAPDEVVKRQRTRQQARS